ncbi:MAG: type IV pilus modification PilV family protein [Trichloromonadaceae bacterium]
MTTLNSQQRGFTLVEVLIALTIFTIGILAVATMQTSSIRYNSAAKLSSEGVFKAERKVEELLAGSHAALGNGGPQTNGPHSLSWNVHNHGTHSTIAVTVTWKEPGGNKSYTLTSIKGDY